MKAAIAVTTVKKKRGGGGLNEKKIACFTKACVFLGQATQMQFK